MKRLFAIISLAFLLSACSSEMATPTATHVLPTATPALPTVTQTATASFIPSSTPEPTNTPEPTSIPLPDGWTSIIETSKIGGRAVVFNEKGDAATNINGKFYPVDYKGCFYKEFYDPQIQKQDERYMDLEKKINSEPSFIFDDSLVGENWLWPRHGGSSLIGYINKKKRPVYREKYIDGILANQYLCFNEQSYEWEHVIDYVLAHSEIAAPDDSFMSRGVVGWIRNDEYVTFTYLQGAKLSAKGLPYISGPGHKANKISDAMDLWQGLLDNREQIGVYMPDLLKFDSKSDFATAFNECVNSLPIVSPLYFNASLQDPFFAEWALKPDNQIHYFSDSAKEKDFYLTHRMTEWRFWGEQASIGEMPEQVIRMIVYPMN